MDGELNQDTPAMSPDRLLRAADVLLAARARNGPSEAFVDAWLGDATPSNAVDRPFTYAELVEGMCFLMRCGLVEPSAPAQTGRSGSVAKRRIEKK